MGVAFSEGHEWLRPIHYMGNKSRYLPQIASAIEELTPSGPVMDLFAGSGVVSSYLGAGRAIVANDIQVFSSVLLEALLKPTCPSASSTTAMLEHARKRAADMCTPPVRALLDVEDSASRLAQGREYAELAALMELGPLEGLVEDDMAQGIVALALAVRGSLPSDAAHVTFRHFGGVFFSFRQALEIDSLAGAIRADAPDTSIPAAALLSTASDLSSTVGNHFAQPLSIRNKQGVIKDKSIANALRIRSLSVYEAFTEWLERYSSLREHRFAHQIASLDYRDALESFSSEVDLVYADPPYTRDHYSRFYHVLETLALGDFPSVSPATHMNQALSKGVYRSQRHQSPFCIRSQVQEAFEALFSIPSAAGAAMVLSYSPLGSGTRARAQTRLMSISEIVQLAEKYYSVEKVEAIEGSRHSRLNRRDLHGEVPPSAEVLISLTC